MWLHLLKFNFKKLFLLLTYACVNATSYNSNVWVIKKIALSNAFGVIEAFKNSTFWITKTLCLP